MLDWRERNAAAPTEKMDDCLSGVDRGMQPMSRLEKNAKRRRFSTEQTKFLEFMYESGSRPESQIKQQLASELGLQPRQVAIWFQNRRARLKTKQIEREYNMLKASHDALASSCESLKKQNESLLTQLQKLKNQHRKAHGSRISELGETQSCPDRKSESIGNDSESKEKPCLLLDAYGQTEDRPLNDHNMGRKEGTMAETDVMNLNEHTDGSMTSPDWHSFESACLIDVSSSSSQWWEFLS